MWRLLLAVSVSLLKLNVYCNENTISQCQSNNCLNGGICYNVSNIVKCQCQEGYTGEQCELATDTCNYNGRTYSCAKGMRCTHNQTDGYHCERRVNVKNITTQTNYCLEKPCPPDWICLSAKLKFDGYLCQPVDHSKIMFPQMRRDPKDDKCVANLCLHSIDCVNSSCVCMQNYEGDYCERKVNYCAANPCGEHLGCVPLPGTFQCRCPDDRMGKKCTILVHREEQRVKHPGLLYQEIQYQNVPSVTAFYVQYPGIHLTMTIDYGDEVIHKFNEKKLIYYPNAKERLKKLFFPPLNLPSNQLYLYFHEHYYETTGIKTIQIHAAKLHNIMYKAKFGIDVRHRENCTLKVKLTNAAKFVTDAIVYSRENTITIFSVARIDCAYTKLFYQWTLHKVENFQTELSKDTIYPKFNKTVLNNQASHFTIPAFSLDFGQYIVVHKVEMLQPRPKIKAAKRTWFIVKRKPLVVHLNGGSLITLEKGVPLRLNASKSYDPNFPLHSQPVLYFSWTCESKNLSHLDDFCYGTRILGNGKLPYYELNTTVLRILERYTFKVKVVPFDLNIDYSRTRVIKVDVLKRSPNLRLECVDNCLGGDVNPNRKTFLQGTFETNKYVRNDLYTMLITKMSKSSEVFYREKLIQKVPGVLHFSINEEIFQSNEQYRVVLKEIDNIWWNDRAELLLTAHTNPLVEKCKMLPLQGIAMLTNFTLKCYNILDDDPPIMFTVYQFVNNIENPSGGLIVTYDYAPLITGIVLSPGQPENNYVTLMNIKITNAIGMQGTYQLHVTVLPTYFYHTNVNELVYQFGQLSAHDYSPLAMHRSGKNFIGVTQMIIAIANTMENFLHSDRCYSINRNIIAKEKRELQDTLMTNVWNLPLLTSHGLQHTLIAVNSVLNLAGTGQLEASTVLGSVVLQNVILALEKGSVRKERITEMLPLIMEIAAKLLPKTGVEYAPLTKGIN